MTDAGAFLRAVADHPDEDGPRLVYADWLDEQGDAARAEFIRVQCAAAALPEFDDRRVELEDRADDLLAAHETDWLGKLAPDLQDWEFRRGFLERVEIGPGEFLARADELFRATPVGHVRFRPDAYWKSDRLGQLLAEPSVRRLAGLDLSCYSTGETWRIVGQAGRFDRLRILDISCAERGFVRWAPWEAIRELVSRPDLAWVEDLRVGHSNTGDTGLRGLSATMVARPRRLDLSHNRLTGPPSVPLADRRSRI